VKRTRASRAIARPPDTAAGDIDQLFERIRTIAPPTVLNGPWAEGFGLSAAAATVLKWLGLVKDGQVDAQLWGEIRVPKTRQDALSRLVREAYAPVFEQVEVAEATKDDLIGAFITEYKMGDPARYVRAFVTLCRHAGIEVGADEAKGEEGDARAETKPKVTSSKAAKPSQRQRNDTAKRSTTEEIRETREQARPAIGVNIEIPADWTDEQVRARIAAVKRALDDAGEP
jgi:hypothetical protein